MHMPTFVVCARVRVVSALLRQTTFDGRENTLHLLYTRHFVGAPRRALGLAGARASGRRRKGQLPG